MKQILVAVDEHPHAAKIVKKAIEMADDMSAKILLIWVQAKVPIPEAYRDQHGDALPEHYFDDQFERTIGPLVDKIKEAGLKCERVVATGNPEREILKAAESKKVDYIVVGARGLRNLNRLRAISSVSRNVIEKSAIPVVTIP